MKLTDLYNYQKTPVSSVNKKIGDVVLFATDVNAIDKNELGVSIPLLKDGLIDENNLPNYPKMVNGKIKSNYLPIATKNTAGIVQIGYGFNITNGVLDLKRGQLNSDASGNINIVYENDFLVNGAGINQKNGLLQLDENQKIKRQFINTTFYNDQFLTQKIYLTSFGDIELSFDQLKIQQPTIVQIVSSSGIVQNNINFVWLQNSLKISFVNLTDEQKNNLGDFIFLKYLVLEKFDVDDVKNYSMIDELFFDPYNLQIDQNNCYKITINVKDYTMIQIIDNTGVVRNDIPQKWIIYKKYSGERDVTLGYVDQNGDFQALTFSGTNSNAVGNAEDVENYYTWNVSQEQQSISEQEQLLQGKELISGQQVCYLVQLDFTNIWQQLQNQEEVNRLNWQLKYVVNFKIDKIAKTNRLNALIYS